MMHKFVEDGFMIQKFVLSLPKKHSICFIRPLIVCQNHFCVESQRKTVCNLFGNAKMHPSSKYELEAQDSEVCYGSYTYQSL
jgi:aspartate carbamoyltransferase regulatory subunit